MSIDLINEQYELEELFLKEFNDGNYTIDKPFIIMDPYKINPLSAYICFKTDIKTPIIVRVKGKNKKADILQTFNANTTHILPVYGLYLNDTTEVEISYYQGNSFTHKLEVHDVDFDENVVVDFEADPILFENKLLLYSTPTAIFRYKLPFALDANGDIRWLLTKPFNRDFKPLKNGRIMVGTGETVVEPYHVTGMYEIDWMGKIHKFYKIDSLYHHDFLEMPNDELLVLTSKNDFITVEDSLIVFNRKTGEINKRLNYDEILDKNKVRRSGSRSEHDWCHNNAVWYDSTNNSLTLSFRHMDTIINVDYDSDKINRILSDPKGWDKDYVDKYFLKPRGYNFDYTYGQHSVSIDEKGNLICFDNHYKGRKHPEYVPAINAHSRGARFIINKYVKTIELDWSYGQDLGAIVYSPYISYVNRFTDNHNLVHFGGITYNDDGSISDYHGPSANERDLDMESRTIEISNGKTLLDVKLKGNYYRARKLDYRIEDYEFEHSKAIIVEVK